MRGYERDDYEDWDEYEEDGLEQEEEEDGEDECEETHQPTQEELEYLSLRQKLKDSIRKQMKKDLGNSGSIDKTNASRKDNYGSFFGPSQPVIAQRVIQESKSLLENPDLAARIGRSIQKSDKTSVSAPVKSKSQASHRPSVANGLKRKVEMLKNTRDYSFLLSEDAEFPASSESPTPRNALAPKSDARSAQLFPRSKPLVNDRVRQPSNGRDGKKPIVASGDRKPELGSEKPSYTANSSLQSRKQLDSNNGSGPGRPLGPKVMPSKRSMGTTGKVTQATARTANSGDRKPTSSVQSLRKPTLSNLQSGGHRPTPSHGQPTILKKPSAPKVYQETSKPKLMTKQAVPTSRVQAKRSPPRVPPRAPLRDERRKAKSKRQLNDEDSEGENAISMIRQMFGYNPSKFRGYDDDDDMKMVANFDDIVREETRSAKIGRQEDEEEERREMMEMMRAKKRKLSRQ